MRRGHRGLDRINKMNRNLAGGDQANDPHGGCAELVVYLLPLNESGIQKTGKNKSKISCGDEEAIFVLNGDAHASVSLVAQRRASQPPSRSFGTSGNEAATSRYLTAAE